MSDDPNTEEQDRAVSLFSIFMEIKTCTPPFARFLQEYFELVNLFMSFVLMATKLDDHKGMTRKLYDIIRQVLNPDEEYRYSETYKSMRRYGDQFSRNMIVGMANNFFSYVSEVLQAVLVNRPEILRSSEKLTTEEILQFSDVNDIVSYVADRKINDLSYGGLKGVEAYLKDRLGVELFKGDHERVLLTILAELRNIHTHNRGVVNRLFLSRLGRTSYQSYDFVLGQPHVVDLDEFGVLARNAIDVAFRLDQGLTAKFRIPTQPWKVEIDQLA
jgi:hypothetical protein